MLNKFWENVPKEETKGIRLTVGIAQPSGAAPPPDQISQLSNQQSLSVQAVQAQSLESTNVLNEMSSEVFASVV